jgi:hypothetical protein
VPGALCTAPAGHALLGVHASWFGDVEIVPSTQGVQRRSVVEVPALETNVPGSQVDHAVQLVAFDVVLNDPLAHAAQARSAFGEGAAVT